MKFKSINLLIIVAALGYFVDIYDLVLFNVVKKESLEALGFTGDLLKNAGITLFNWQMLGMLVGGLFWGILGDKRGRVSILFGSILMYSLANIANAFVTDINSYIVLRFLAGLGLAGELGAGITLVSESMDKENRGYGTMVIVTFGALGAVVASLVGQNLGWKAAYLVGGGLGLILLMLRAGAFESGMFEQVKKSDVPKGSLALIFKSPSQFIKYLNCILIGLPIWCVIGVFIALSDQFGKEIGVRGEILVAKSVMYSYIGLSVGDLLSGMLSQWFRSRKKIILLYLFFLIGLIFLFLLRKNVSTQYFYTMCFLLGAGAGYWALFVTNAAEQFGTNIRSTVANTVPNFVRGAVVPITLSFKALQSTHGLIWGGLIVSGVCFVLAIIATISVKETFGKDLDYVEVS